MKKIILIVSVTVISLIITGKVLDTKYKKYWWPFFDKLDVLIKDSSYYDGIYLGNSRTHFGINPYYVDSITGLKTYNMGMGGATINEINFIAKNYLQKHTAPKFALISIGYGGIIKTDRYLENPCYYLFYTQDSFINHILQNLHYHTVLYKILPVLKYTSFDDFNKFSIVENFKGKTILRPGGIAYRGFINNSTNVFNVQALEKIVEENIVFQPGIDILEKTIRLFKEKNTMPILVFPPGTNSEKKLKLAVEVKIDSAIESLSSKYQIPLLHFDTDSAFTDNYFTDASHLNIQGTVIYSKKIGFKIISIFHNSSTIKTQ